MTAMRLAGAAPVGDWGIRGRCRTPMIAALFVIALTAGWLHVDTRMAGAQDTAEEASRFVTVDVVHTIDPQSGSVAVRETIFVRNDQPSRVVDGERTSYFWTGHSLWIPAGALDLSVVSNGIELEVELVTESELADLYLATYPTSLEFGQSRTLDVTYRLETYGSLNDGPRRLNAAFFNLTLVTCCRFQEATIEVRIPKSYRVTAPNDMQFVRYDDGEEQIYRYQNSGLLAEYLISEWFGFDNARLVETEIQINDSTITLVSLPDTPKWPLETADLVSDLAAELTLVTGREWPLKQARFRQAGSQFDFDVRGYGDLQRGDVSLPEDFSARGMALTLAQPLLPEQPFDDEFLNDGIVTDFAAAGLSSVGSYFWDPAPLSEDGFVPSADGFWFARQISSEIGHDGVLRLIELATSDETAFVGDGPPEEVFAGTNDWRRVIDLLEQRIGLASIDELFAAHLLDPEQQVELDRRNRLLGIYDDAMAVAPHPGPIGIRTALTNWRLAEAETLLDALTNVIAEHEKTAAAATDVGLVMQVELPDWSTATSPSDFDALATPYQDRRAVLGQIVGAERRLASDRGLVEDLGFDREEATSRISRARAAFEADDLTAVDAELAAFVALEDEANTAGRNTLLVRFVAPAVALVVLLIGAWRMRTSRRRGRQLQSGVEA